MGHESAPKTRASDRTISLAPELREILRAHVGDAAPDRFLLVNQAGGPVNQRHWPREYWRPCIDALELRWRKFYATRHTFISLALSEGADVYGVAKYCGTSVAMIERHYGKYTHRGGGVAAFVNKIGEAKTQRLVESLRFLEKKHGNC